MSKICIKCNILKDLSEYHRDKSKKDGHRSICKSCIKIYQSTNENVKEKQKEYRKNNRNKLIEYNKKYKKENSKNMRIYKRNYDAKRKLIDPLFKMKHNIVNLIRLSFKNRGYSKKSKTCNILGCDYQTLFEYIESQFDEHMTWNNQGSYWDIDHIIPLASANNEEDIIRLNHYTNLQPLESYYNRYIKRNKV